MRLLIQMFALLFVAIPAFAVPLAEWVADEAKLLGEEPVTLADLPDEWQGLGEDELVELMGDLSAEAEEKFYGSEYSEALPGYQRYVYIARYTNQQYYTGIGLNNIGLVYDNLGQYEEALDYHERSLAIRRKTGDIQGEGESLGSIGTIYKYLGQYEEALDYYEQSLEIFREIGDIQGEGTILNNIGSVYSDLGQYEEALDYYEQSLAIYREIGDIQGEGTNQNNIGTVYSYLGQYEQALDYYEQSLAIDREIGDIQGKGTSLNNIGGVYWYLGQYEQALEYHQQSLAIKREIGDIRGEGIILDNIGLVYMDLGQCEQALEYHEQSLAIKREIGDIQGEGQSLNNIGLVFHEHGQYEQALDYYEQSLAIEREIGDIQGEGIILNNIGAVYDELGQYEQALEYHEQYLAIAREIGDIHGEETSLYNIGFDYRSRGKYEEALTYSQQAFDIAFSQALQFSWESGSKEGLVGELSKHANMLIDVQIELGMPREAFATLQSAKGFSLLQLLTQAQVQLTDPDAQQQLAGYRNANASLQTYREQLRDVTEDDDEQRAYINARIEEWQAKASDAWDYLRENAPEITDIISVKGLTQEEVQDEVLHDVQVVLEYMVTDDDIVVFCLPKDGELVVGRAEMPDLGETEFKDWLGRRIELLYAKEPQISDQAAKALYQLLIEPVEEYIPAGAELIICPDRELFIVPFEALMDDELLLDKHSITYSTSATMLSYIKPAGGAEGALIAGVSFGAGEDDQTSLPDQRSADLVRGRIFAENLPALPGVIDEANEIAAIYGIEPVLDELVTEEFLREMMPGHRVIHLATHGYLSDIPLLNGLVTYLPGTGGSSLDRGVPILPSGDDDLPRDVPILPGGDDDLPRETEFSVNTYNDGFLTMAEVMGIPLAGCELVTLSACHSAEGEVAPGEGVMGLSQGFMYAGARSILASLTKVDDTATKLLMVEFYQNWDSGMSKREALRVAKLKLIRSGYAAPKYWAPFVLYGVE